MTEAKPQLPASNYQCADWPNPPVNATRQSDIALWLTEVYAAFDDCKQTLATIDQIN